ncbi:MAG TPA: TAT-variant-translocated molybdopterin oxidoreductase [Acidobacteriaceae bacterium]|nr:TAT-variant-translocated molybdopterin oxidoreductase [Acidobacteriaceae bacterium]
MRETRESAAPAAKTHDQPLNLQTQTPDNKAIMSNQRSTGGSDTVTISPAAGMTLTLEEARARLAGKTGKKYWRSVDELADTPAFRQALEREFPSQASEWIDPVSRRGFLKVMGASLALAGLSGCTKQPDETIYPYVKQPEDLVLGRPVYFATAFPFPTGAVPLLVKSDAYRPIKVDGNPEHPYNQGGSDPISQGTLLDLYDPDRSQRVLYRGEPREWPAFLAAFRAMASDKKANGGSGLYILSDTVTSPTLAAQWKAAQQTYPNAKWIQWDPVNRDSAYAASKTAFGDYYDAQYRLAEADVIVSLDADFLSGITHPGFLRLAADYAKRRRVGADGSFAMNRLYAVESTSTTTGFKAEHRLALKASEVQNFAAALAAAVGAQSGGAAWGSGAQQKFLSALAADLKANGGKCVVIAGEQQPPAVHLAAIAINQALGNVGKTVVYTETVNPMPSIQGEDLRTLVGDMQGGKVDWLVILNANPVYTAPVDLRFEDALGKVKTIVHLGSHFDETAAAAEWHVNGAHYLEMWSDARAYDGTLSVVQPMIDPLYGGKSAHEVIQSLLPDPDTSAYQAVRNNWSATQGSANQGGGQDQAWRKVLHDGFVAGSAFSPKTVSAKVGALPMAAASGVDGTVEVVFRPDPNIYDGRYANVGWLQEIPKPVTNMSWDNAALMSYATLGKYGLAEQDVVTIESNGNKVLAPVYAIPGHPDDSVTVYLGYGRRTVGRVGAGLGFNAYAIRTSGSLLFAPGAKLSKTGQTYEFAVTKSHYTDHRSKWAGGDGTGTHSLEGNEAMTRGIIRYATLEEFQRDPNFAHEETPAPEDPEPTESMFSNWRYDKNAWAMAIDMNSCVGCNACIVSCYAENNIAVVGKHNTQTGRIMQWIRIDTYFEGDLEAPRAHFQPMTCQQCENAPCEQVCPVGATVHTPEGLNVMVYNRCVGTRYCSNNCPYKVRRFNFLLYSDYETESLKLMRNPDVTVRSRGVMEKCSYCSQRIMAAKIAADKENRAVRDGEIVTACQQACPTGAIVFGNVNDKASRVYKLKSQQRNYGVLADLNTRPRTTYIAGVINPNPELAEAQHAPENS